MNFRIGATNGHSGCSFDRVPPGLHLLPIPAQAIDDVLMRAGRATLH